jgi:hypothetical protein
VFLTNLIKRAELTVNDKNNAATNVINIVIGIYDKNLHITHGKNISGKNATNVVIVQAISGALKSLTASNIAERLSYHNLIFSEDHSIITITVSIAIQRVNTSEKLVKKLRDNHIASSTQKVTKNARGINIEAIKDSLNHTNKNIVRNTNIIVCMAVFERF